MANDHLARFITHARQDTRIASYNLLQLKQAVVLKVLHLLGWDAFNASEVVPDFNAGGMTIDYALQAPAGAIFLHIITPLNERTLEQQEKVIKTAAGNGIRLAILTDGLRWSLYTPLPHVSLRDKEFCRVDFTHDDPQVASSTLKKAIARRIVASGTAFARAEKTFNERNKRKQQLLSTSLVETWRTIAKEAERIFSELLVIEVKRLLGQDVPLSAATDVYRAFVEITTNDDPPKRTKYENVDAGVSYAWSQLLKQLHPILTELIVSDIERIHQFRADTESVEAFLAALRRAHDYASPPFEKPKPRKQQPA
jgi:predicted type IV restriction endonuclease